jgi:hypothetical protein
VLPLCEVHEDQRKSERQLDYKHVTAMIHAKIFLNIKNQSFDNIAIHQYSKICPLFCE